MPNYPPPLLGLYYSRLREFYRQPARIFWVYGFPSLLALGLGLAFSNRKAEPTFADVVDRPAADGVIQAFETYNKSISPASKSDPATRAPVVFHREPEAEALHRLRIGKTPLVIFPETDGSVTYRFDPTRPEAVAARSALDEILQRAAGRTDPRKTIDQPVTAPGSRYIDFLIPGLIGQNTMGGGLWGVGFLLVNFRIAKLLKRFAATPMPRRDFLLAILMARLTFLVPDVAVLLGLGVFVFGMPVIGSLWLVALVEVVGALAFSGIGLLIACRASATETVTGLMNLVMLPMWIFSGIFFSTDRFPDSIQWFVQALPLTQLLNALRAIMLDGADLGSRVVVIALAVLAAWAVGTFVLALRFFRWQ
jgi:ABC transporter DrrB family efflux protein